MSQLYGKVDKVLAAIDKSDSNGFLRGEDFMKIIWHSFQTFKITWNDSSKKFKTFD